MADATVELTARATVELPDGRTAQVVRVRADDVTTDDHTFDTFGHPGPILRVRNSGTRVTITPLRTWRIALPPDETITVARPLPEPGTIPCEDPSRCAYETAENLALCRALCGEQ